MSLRRLPPRARRLPDWVFYRQVLVAALDDVTNTADDLRAQGLDYRPVLADAMRLLMRLLRVQMEIEKHDLD
jgi:hypothetical protein